MRVVRLLLTSVLLVTGLATPVTAQSAVETTQRVLSGFPAIGTGLSIRQKQEIRALLTQSPNLTSLTCSGLRLASASRSVAIVVKKRAIAACGFAKTLKPNLATAVVARVTRVANNSGRVLITLSAQNENDASSNAEPPTAYELLSPVSQCQISQASNPNDALRAGFPRSPAMQIKNNKLVVQLIYVDFPDLTDSAKPSTDIDFWRVGVNRFFDAASESRVKFEWRYENQYFRMPKKISEYGIKRYGGGNAVDFVQEAIRISDPVINFTDVDFVVVVMPPNVTMDQANVSPALVLSPSSPFATSEGTVYRGTLAAGDTRFPEGYLLIVHEFGHLLGLQDYYSYSWRDPAPYHEQFKFMGQFDNMNFAPGDSREWIAWSRWLLDFLPNDKVRCLGAGAPIETIHELTAASTEQDGPQMVVIPTSSTTAIAIESRRNLRFDAKAKSRTNGLLVYRIDTSRPSGFGPIEVIKKPGSSDPYFADATLRRGESLTVEGITVTNIGGSAIKDVVKVVLGR